MASVFRKLSIYWELHDSLVSNTCSKDFTFSTFLPVLKQNSLGKF